jgi:hypothetical protein
MSERVAKVRVGNAEFGVGLKVHSSNPAWKENEDSCGGGVSNC